MKNRQNRSYLLAAAIIFPVLAIVAAGAGSLPFANGINEALGFLGLENVVSPTATAAVNSDGRTESGFAPSAALTPGNLLVYRVGDGAAALTNAATPVFLDEYTPAGALVQSIALPTSVSGSNQILTASGTATSEGSLTRTTNGSYIVLTGYNAAPGTASVASTTAAANPRVIGRIDATGNIDTSTALTDAYSANNIRGAASVDGTAFWTSGTVTSTGGTRYATFGSTTSTQISSTLTNTRTVNIFGGQLYVSSGSGAFFGVSTVGTGLPTTTGQTTTILPGFPTATGPSPYNFAFFGANTIYVADDRATASGGGLQKWTLGAGTWTLAATFSNGLTSGLRGLTLTTNGSNQPVIWATSADSASKLVSFIDTGSPGDTFNTVATAATNTVFRGVAFTPGAAGPSLAISNTGTPAAGNVASGASNVPLFGFQLSPSGGNVNFTALKLTTAGTATTSDLSNFQVVYDVNNNGVYDSGTDVIVSSGAQPLANPINFSITGQTGFSSARRYLVIANVAAGAVSGRTFTGSIAAPADVTASVTPTGTAAGNTQTIAAGANDLTMSGAALSESATISSLVNDATITTTAQGAQAWQITFNNAAGNAGVATISAATFTQGASNGIADWTAAIQAAELFDGSTPLAAGTISATSISFSGLSVGVADGSSKTLSLRISLKSTAGALIDNSKFQFALTDANVTVAGNGLPATSLNSDQTRNVIAVVATRLVFTSVPSTVTVNSPFSATVRAQDINGNTDLDQTASVTVTKASGSGTLSGGGALSLVAGVQSWPTLQYNTAGIFTIQAAGGGLTAATSGNISASSPVPFTPGNLVVYRVGDGSAALSSNASAVFLDEYTPAGVLIQSIALPTAVNGANQILTASGSATSEGSLTRSANGAYIVLTGYNAAPGTAGVAATTAAASPRVIGRVNASGNIDTSTALTDAYSANNIRGAASVDGTAFWTAGTVSGSGGTRYATLGSTTSTQISSTLTNTRTVNIFGGQLYISSGSGAFFGVSSVGTGLPTTSGETTTILPGFPTASGPSPYNFAFFGANTIYVADDRAVASGGGLQKWTLSSGTWTLAATFSNGLTSGLRGLTLTTNGSNQPVIWATSADSASKLVSFTDTGSPGDLFNIVAAASTNTAFRGVALAPVGGSPLPDLTIGVSGPATGTVGVPYAYSVTVNNVGSAGASSVKATFALPSGVTFGSAIGTNGFSCGQAAGVVSCTGGSINNGSSGTITVNVTPTSASTVNVPAGAAIVDPDNTIPESNEGNNASTGTVSTVVSGTTARRFLDFDGDGKTDLSVFRPNGTSGSEWWLLKSSGGSYATQFGSPTDKLVAADYTGDGKADIAFWRPSTGQWFILRSEDSTFYAFPFGGSGDIPAPADFDGDGKADAAVFRPSTATWYINNSGGGTTIQQFGLTTDLPVPADFDGDGKADIAVYRPTGANGSEWWIQRSTAGLTAFAFGSSTDKAVVGDYTGDGKADVAFWRPSTGLWYVLRSEDLSFYAFPFGASTDIPAPGDYDGDGKTDAAVFRPSNSTWYIQGSTAGTIIQQWGTAGDVPVPNEFVR